MTAYISVSYSKRKSLDPALTAIAETLHGFNIDPFIFVDHYQFDPAQEQAMMQQAMADIERAYILIAETSDKGIGIGIEVGYAKAKNKPVIYLRQTNAEHSTTVSGISDFRIIYDDVIDLKKQLADTVRVLLKEQQLS
jgi:nucleoside 2-deoxyribosyltransferase